MDRPDIRGGEVGGCLGDIIGTLAGTLGAEGVDRKAGGGDSKWMSLSDTRAHCSMPSDARTQCPLQVVSNTLQNILAFFWFTYELEYKTRILTKLHAEVNRILVNVGKA